MGKKFLKLILLFFFISFIGFLNYYQETELKIDGSGKMYCHFWSKFSEQDSVILKQLGIFERDSIVKYFSAEGIDIIDTEKYYDKNDSSWHGKIFLKFVHIDSLNKIAAFSDFSFIWNKGSKNLITFIQKIKPFGGGVVAIMPSYAIEFVYYIPGKIYSHNAAEINNNKLTWRFNSKEIGTEKKIYVLFKPYKLKETPEWIYYATFIVLILVFYYLFRKK